MTVACDYISARAAAPPDAFWQLLLSGWKCSFQFGRQVDSRRDPPSGVIHSFFSLKERKKATCVHSLHLCWLPSAEYIVQWLPWRRGLYTYKCRAHRCSGQAVVMRCPASAHDVGESRILKRQFDAVGPEIHVHAAGTCTPSEHLWCGREWKSCLSDADVCRRLMRSPLHLRDCWGSSGGSIPAFLQTTSRLIS